MILDMLLNESMTSNYDHIQPTSNGYEPSLYGMNQIISEGVMDMHNINTACAVAEYKALDLLSESCYSDAIMLQEAAISGFFKKMRELFEKMLAKIKEFFDNVKLYFSKMTKDDTFLKNYEKELKDCNTTDFEYEGFEYTLSAVSLDSVNSESIKGDSILKKYGNPDTVVSEAKKSATDADKKEENLENLKKFIEDKDDFKTSTLENARKQISGETDETDFKESIYKKLRNGEDTKGEISVSVNDIIKTMKLNDRTLSEIDSARRSATRNIELSLKYVDDCDKKLSKHETDDQDVRNFISKLSEVLKFISGLKKDLCDIVNAAAGMKVQAAKDNCKQARDIGRKLLIHNRKSNKKKLSDSYNGAENILDLFM